LRKGDIQHLKLTGPTGQQIASATQPPLDNNKAQYMVFVGKKMPAAGWPAGEYVADYKVVREGQVVLEKKFSLQL
jgi:hypothetical protein